jgi:hypothetical protein
MSIPSLNITARTTLGAMLVLSSAYFQAGASNLIGAEGENMQTLVAAVSGGSLGIGALPASNSTLIGTLNYLEMIEAQILAKVQAGIQIHSGPVW